MNTSWEDELPTAALVSNDYTDGVVTLEFTVSDDIGVNRLELTNEDGTLITTCWLGNPICNPDFTSQGR